jgi:hypothetical protein
MGMVANGAHFEPVSQNHFKAYGEYITQKVQMHMRWILKEGPERGFKK